MIKADAKTEAAVLAVVDGMAKAYARRDVDGILALFINDPTTMVIGSGADEKYVGLAEYKAGIQRDFAQSESVSMELKNSVVSAAGQAAWLTCDLTAHGRVGGQDITMSGRLTGVLVKQGDKWLIAQMHWSMPYGGQAPGQSWPSPR